MVENEVCSQHRTWNSPERAASSNLLGLLLQSRKTFVVTSCSGLASGGVLVEKGLTSVNLSNLSSSRAWSQGELGCVGVQFLEAVFFEL